MAQYIYKGLTEAAQKELVKAHTAGLVPPEKRGQPTKYRIDKEDDEDVREAKRKLKAQWLKDREKEAALEAEKLSASVSYVDDLAGKTLVFEKGKPVTVTDGSALSKRLDAMSDKRKERCSFEKVEGKK
jgi:hypothetical protein